MVPTSNVFTCFGFICAQAHGQHYPYYAGRRVVRWAGIARLLVSALLFRRLQNVQYRRSFALSISGLDQAVCLLCSSWCVPLLESARKTIHEVLHNVSRGPLRRVYSDTALKFSTIKHHTIDGQYASLLQSRTPCFRVVVMPTFVVYTSIEYEGTQCMSIYIEVEGSSNAIRVDGTFERYHG